MNLVQRLSRFEKKKTLLVEEDDFSVLVKVSRREKCNGARTVQGNSLNLKLKL
jgi:hypothetical protein